MTPGRASSTLLFVALACNGKDNGDTGRVRCAVDADCAAGWVCEQEECVKLCNIDSDCPLAVEACRGGLCYIVDNPSCAADDECTSPGECQLESNRRCVAGECTYGAATVGVECDDADQCTSNDVCDADGRCVGAAMACDDPPDDQCVSGDAEIIVYSPHGQCSSATGQCSYYSRQVACASCPACATHCDVLECPSVEAGGCRINGVCVPLDPAYCSYRIAGDGLVCDLVAGAPDNGEGVCAAGECVDCVVGADCTAPPGSPACFTTTCDLGVCYYTAVAGVECSAATCENDTLFSAQVCGPQGLCPEPAESSCDGYRCAGDGSSCRTECTGDHHCAEGYACTGGACR